MEENPKEENPKEESSKEQNPVTLDEMGKALVEAAKSVPPGERGSSDELTRRLKTPVGGLNPQSK
jgi:hypothetical protein